MQQPHGHTLKAFDQDLADLRALDQPRWASSPKRRSRKRCAASSSATTTAARRARRSDDVQLDDARGRGGAPRRRADRAAGADGRRPARSRRRAQDRRRSRAHRRLCQEHRQAGPACSRSRRRSSRCRCSPRWRGSRPRWSTTCSPLSSSAIPKLRPGPCAARRCARRFLRSHLPHAAHLHDGKSAEHRAVDAPCCSSPRTSSGSATMRPTSPRWSIIAATGERAGGAAEMT